MLRIYNHFVSRTVFALLLLEVLILIASTYLGANFRFFDSTQPLTSNVKNIFSLSIVFVVVMTFSMSALGMYQSNILEGFRNTFLRLMPSCMLGFVLIMLVFYMVPDLYFGRGILGLMFLVAAPGILLVRVLFFKSGQTRFLEIRIMVLGAGPLAEECKTVANENIFNHKYNIVGFVPMAGEESRLPQSALLPMEGSLIAMAKKYNASEIIVSVQNRRSGAFPIRDLLVCKSHGIKVTDSSAFFEREACQIRVDSLQPSWLVFGNGFEQSFFRRLLKKVFDLVVSIIIFIVALPILVVTALLIFAEDHGPIFYRQERVGKNGKKFMVLKFRSMRSDAESGKPQWASTNDPRTTRVGRIIRLLRIDEFPQILNVIKGEMSFVGPRPERPFFVDQLNQDVPYYSVRHCIKPGITGMAQVRYHYGASVADAVQKLQYDLYYVKNNSLFLDVLILIDTLQVVITGKGSR